MPRICFTVTNDLTYDQRMIRICRSLASAGYEVELVGRKLPSSIPLKKEPYRQKRLSCLFRKGPCFYAEYNLRLFIYLLFRQYKLVCAIDLDSILAVYFASVIRGNKRVYDAHELFCEMKEIVSRPRIYAIWKRIERFAVPRFPMGYTVNQVIADEFRKLYGVDYDSIRSIAKYEDRLPEISRENYILYQGAVNEGRSFETLIPAMQWVNSRLLICGDGNFMNQARELVALHGLSDKVEFRGMVPPDQLREITRKAKLGITLFDREGKSNYFSLANRFFDYMHAGVPQVCSDYPVYRDINNSHGIAVLISNLSPVGIAEAINSVLSNDDRWQQLTANCVKASKQLNWQNEEKKLLSFYSRILG